MGSAALPKNPVRLREFIITVLWCKLPVAQRLMRNQVLHQDKCPLCRVLGDHEHVFKTCFYLQDSLALVRRLWGVHVSDNTWFEPSRMCTDFPLLSVTTVQGWLVWSALYARWLIRCEALSVVPPDTATAVLQRLYSMSLMWKSLSRGSLPSSVITTTRECLKDVLRVRDRLRRLTQQLGGHYRIVPLMPPPNRQGNDSGTRAYEPGQGPQLTSSGHG